jgi:hypothetical protein
MSLDPATVWSGLLVGIVVGFTGVGGGSLMTPILVLLLGVAPHTAVGTDLLFASVTKMVGVTVHHHQGTVDWRIVRLLATGSLPAAAATLVWMRLTDASHLNEGLLITAVGVALLLTSLGIFFKERLHALGRHLRLDVPVRFKAVQRPLTVATGAVLGVLVALTSIGAGALGTTFLVYLYPLRLTPRLLVGTDLAHAIPLALLTGLGHLWLGNVSWSLLGTLLVGSIPGVIAGSLVGTLIPLVLVQRGIALVLGAVALKMLLG